MTSINIQTLSNKSEYKNYFSEPITFPKNAMVSMPKANLQVPTYVSPIIETPTLFNTLSPGAYDVVACAVEIDGIRVDVSWRDIYDSHVFLESAEEIQNYTIDNYYNDNATDSNYQYFPNNQFVFYNSVAAQDRVKTDFNTILAHAINAKYDFYDVNPAPIYKEGIQTKSIGNSGEAIAVPRANLLIESFQHTLTHLGFSVSYTPVTMSNKTPTFLNVNNDVKVNWIQGGALHALRAATGNCLMFGNQVSMDYNGGWLTTFPNLINTTGGEAMAWGLQLVGIGTQGNDVKHPLAPANYQLGMIDIGLEFTFDTDGNHIFKVIDGGFYDNTNTWTHNYVNKYNSNGFDNNGDHFFIQIERADLYSSVNTAKYVVKIVQGTTIDINTGDAQVVYSKVFELNNGDIQLIPVYMANNDAATSACELNTNAFILKTQQTIEQSFYPTGNFALEARIEDNLSDIFGTANFWASWGLFSKNIYGADNNSNVIFSQIGNGNEGLRKTWSNPTNLEAAEIYYFLGQKNINKIIKNSADGNVILLATENAITDLPQLLYVNLNNIDIKNYPGTYPQGVVVDTKGGDTRVIGTIPFPINDVDLISKYVDVSYEPYNLLYRPINNPMPFTLNQFNVEIYYKDFNTNIKKNIDEINGTMNIEFHVKNGAPPPKVINELRPY